MREPDYNILARLRQPTSKNVQRVSLVGQQFHRLTVYALAGYEQTAAAQSYWLCRCSCGNWTITAKTKLKSGLTKSCGCLKDENTGNRSRTHGKSKTLLYRRWSDMHTRCYNPKFKHYHNYGERGIQVEERWHDFENFHADMGEPPTPKHQIERLNNDGNYGPANCVWATRKQQARNTRKNVFLTAKGETHCISEWAELLGMRPTMIVKRRLRGWDDEQCLGFKEPPPQKGRLPKPVTT